MADTEIPKDFVQVEQTTENGIKYLVTYQNAEEAAKAEKILGDDGDAELTGDNYYTASVDWPVGSSAHLTGEVLDQLGIDWYALSETHALIGYKYRLDFHTNAGGYKLWFVDEEGGSGGTYFKLVVTGGNYSIGYGSNKPKIVSIRLAKLVGK